MNQGETSLKTSFAQLFGQQLLDLPLVDRIEIPLIQRDYAQGRQGEVVERIRTNFIDALCAAVIPSGAAIGLDFVYGDVEKGALYPLDGQQRLTTLFLLHWYLAWRADVPIQNQPWTKFTYATRPSARLFCIRVAEFQPPADAIVGDGKLSDWLTDQCWYLYTWQHDPTIQSMLVMLDSLHQWFCKMKDLDFKAVWNRLTDTQQPAISFYLLPMTANGLTDDLYIKMNSRGKPLTTFENFKAQFENVLNKAYRNDETDYFAKKVDTEWSDTLWQYRGKDNFIDDKFMRYFRFVTEVCACQGKLLFSDKTLTEDLAESVYGKGDVNATNSLQFLFRALDTWHEIGIKDEFESLFTAKRDGIPAKLILFDAFDQAAEGESSVDLFGACCRHYGESAWSLSHTLLLFAVLLNRIHNTVNFPRRLRILRNLIEASRRSELREQQMPELLDDVKRISIDCALQDIIAFNQAQAVNEKDKEALLAQAPNLRVALYSLEDHPLLRGCLASFDLDPSINPTIFTSRANAFHALFDNSDCWKELTGALLAIGDYSRPQGQRFSDFGAPKNTEPWRALLGGTKMAHLIKVLMELLDRVAAANNNLACLQTIQQGYLQQCARTMTMDWRYYFVKYPAMREGDSGRYAGIMGKVGGYNVCMLRKNQMNSIYRDPYLFTIWRQSAVGDAVFDPWFSGYETEPRRMVLQKSRVQIQCVDQGWQITGQPIDPAQKRAFDQVCSKHGIGESGLCIVPQNDSVDTEDRVVSGANILRDLVDLGL